MRKNGTHNLYIISACGLAMGLAACATTAPEGSSALDQARAGVQQLEAEPLAPQVAVRSLEDARDALAAAENAARDHRPVDEVLHLAYLAQRNAEIGEAMVNEAVARSAMARSQSERDQVLLEARARDLAASRQQTLDAQQSALVAQQQAQASQQVAQDAQQQAQVSEQAAQEAQQQATDAQAQLQAMQAVQTDRGMVVTLPNVFFDSGSDSLKPGADEMIARLGHFLQGHPNIVVRIEGHTDSFGSESYNLALSQQRAEAVAAALENNGIQAMRIQAVGRGKSTPIAGNGTGAGRQQNRRVDIIFSDSQGQFVAR
jgi:outer membrane protein OmpA-like peptidoglycan-associated protein